MAFEIFFKNSVEPEPLFFDEGPRIVKTKPDVLVNTSSIVTVKVDKYRQGVELTQQKHFDAGLLKIHAGEPGHVLRKNRYGQDKNYSLDDWFQEIDYFDPVDYLTAQADPTTTAVFTFPIITGDNNQIENLVFDGVIEPLLIREVASFFSTEAPFFSRTVKGSLMAGNDDIWLASDRTLTVYAFETALHQPAYLDMIDMLGNVPLNGYFDPNRAAMSPFTDVRYARNEPFTSVEDVDIRAALSPLTGSTDAYVRFDEKSSTCGFIFDNSPLGTDSMIFGGLLH